MVLAAGAVLLAAAPLLAQDGGIGAKGGVVLASQQNSGSSTTPLDTRVGVEAGGFVNVPFGSHLSFQAEGLFTSKGGKLDVLGITSTLQIDYLEIPLLARLRLGSGSPHYFVDGGAAPAVRLRARSRTAFSGATEEIDVADQVERVDLGVAAGGGVVFGKVDAEVRYTFGVRDIDADRTDGVRTKNRALTITAGIRF